MENGLFISFEGIDGCGKSTQLRLLAARLMALGLDVVETVEPGGTEIGRAIRGILLDPQNQNLAARAELLLYFASRAQNVEQVIAPALNRGAIVLCDRFTDSTVVYQGAGRGLNAETIWQLHRIACGALMPQLTLLLDIDLQTSRLRANARNLLASTTETRMDDETIEFFERVRAGYERLAQSDRARIRVIDACGSVEEVADRIWETIKSYV